MPSLMASRRTALHMPTSDASPLYTSTSEISYYAAHPQHRILPSLTATRILVKKCLLSIIVNTGLADPSRAMKAYVNARHCKKALRAT